MTTTTDAVEVLADILRIGVNPSFRNQYEQYASFIVSNMVAKGFTITRQPAMTDAELDWQRDLDLVKLNLEQLRGLSGFILTDGELDVLIQRVARVTEHFSKKYRG